MRIGPDVYGNAGAQLTLSPLGQMKHGAATRPSLECATICSNTGGKDGDFFYNDKHPCTASDNGVVRVGSANNEKARHPEPSERSCVMARGGLALSELIGAELPY